MYSLDKAIARGLRVHTRKRKSATEKDYRKCTSRNFPSDRDLERGM